MDAIPNYFPRIYVRTDDAESYTIEFGKNHFGLEEFIEEGEKKELNLDYFSLIGGHIGSLHNSFCSFSSRNPRLLERLSGGDFLNEASLVSMYLDLRNSNKNKHKYLR